nr:ethylene-responsive transcription factor 5-like [Aegilops tauschii subsp. strangulata]
MPPRLGEARDFRGVRLRPSGVYYAEIRSGDTRLGLGTFETAHEAARAYDAAASRLGRPRAHINFSDVRTREQAQEFAPPPRLVTEGDRRVQRRRERRLLIAEADEHAIAVWRKRFPQDVVAENEFWAQRRAKQAARQAVKHARKALAEAQCELGPASIWDQDDPRWVDAFTSLDYTTEEDE